MSGSDHSDAIYLKYKSLEDMLKVIVYSSQSALGLTPTSCLYNRKIEKFYLFKLGRSVLL
jgi:hypothetical protein